MMNRIALVFILLLVGIPACLFAQNQPSAAETASGLRSQLQLIQERENALLAQRQQLDEALKPENIERSQALNGSTRPELAREAMRRQLEAEKAGVNRQLDELARDKARIEGQISAADARAYQESANPVDSSALQQQFSGSMSPKSLWIATGATLTIILLGMITLFMYRRRQRSA
jgi:hypothetical protein